MRHSQALIPTLSLLCLLQLSSAINCPQGTFIKHDRCVLCPPGTYQRQENQTECKKCISGRFSPSSGATTFQQCLECAPGTFSTEGARKCTICPPGTFSRVGYSKCLSCPAGSALDQYDNSCRKCAPAFYRPAGTPSTICLFCPSGTGSHFGATKCEKCPKGTYRDRQFIKPGGRDSILGCRHCPKNTFADVKGSVQCKLCPLGSIAEEKGAIKCTSCPTGTFRGRIKKKTCTPCPEGTSSKGKMPAACKHSEKGCPVNTFEDRNGECRACMPGARLDVRNKECVQCGPREVSLGGVTTECTTCPLGQRPANANTIFEKSRCECEDGTVPLGTTGCRKCPPGSRWTNRPAGAIWYVFTRINYYRDAYCEMCPNGFFTDTSGMTECTVCPPGTYTNLEGSTSCTSCPDGFMSRAGDPLEEISDYSDLRTTCLSKRNGCVIGQRSDKRGKYGECITQNCPPNTRDLNGCGQCWFDEFYDRGTHSCKKCPEGQSNPRGVFPRCKVCPKGATSYYGDGGCVCDGKYGDNGKGACSRCKEGEASVNGKCELCGKDSYFRIRNGIQECKKCTGNTFKLREGHRRCTKCRNGFKKARDVFGQEVNACVPKDLYPVS